MSAPHDPWKNVETFIADICLRDGDMLDVDVCLRTAVDAARAADAAQHQQEIDEKDKRLARWEGDGGLHAAVAELNGYGPDWPTHGNAPLAIAVGYALLKSRAEQAEAELATLRATVEQQAARITALEQALRRKDAAIQAFLDLWPIAMEQINGAIVLQSLRAGRDTYTGPNLGPQIEALRQALETAPQGGSNG